MKIPLHPKHWLTITTVFSVFILQTLGQPAFLKDGLAAYYPFNGNANDESGNGRNGQVYGAQFREDRSGKPNSAIQFNTLNKTLGGKGDIVEVPSGINLVASQGWAINLWVSPAAGPWSGNEIKASMLVGSSAITPSSSKSDFRLWLGISGDLNWEYTGLDTPRVVANGVVQLRKWQCLTVSVLGQEGSLYKDGVLLKRFAVSPQYNFAGAYAFGQHHQGNGYWYFYDGFIDDVRIYKRALSDAEVKLLYDYESIPVVPIIASQPQNQTTTAGNDVTFCVAMKDNASYNYQWQLNEQNIPGATLNCYTINSVTAAMNGGRYRVIVSNSAGTIISDSATLTVVTPPPPVIATQPIGKTVQEGSNVSFAVVASGQGALVYQWQLNEQNLPGAISATLNLTGVKQNQAGRYRVLVSSPYGVTISDTVSLIVNANPPPTIVTQPISKTPAEGTQVSLTVTATGIGALTYQWQVNNQNIPGATSSTLVLSAVRPSANGNYRVIVGNPYGITISTEATVTVVVTDADSDGLSDYNELLLGTSLNKADTDGDGLSDFAEVRTHGSNPLTTDTDGDGYSDGIEVARDGNPNNRSVTPTGALAVFPAVDVEFYTLNGVKYQLEVSTDMAVWSAQGGVVVGNGGNQNYLVRASKATQFWRLKVIQ
jgi:hypothetical protein